MKKSFWKNKKILITGNTGFVGSWLCMSLLNYGSEIFGYSNKQNVNDKLFKCLNLSKRLKTYYNDINDVNKLQNVYRKINPDIVIHLAAQPYVKKSFYEPYKTMNDNVLGTLNLLEIIRKNKTPKMSLIITSDKCYQNLENKNYFKETDPMGGLDIYSASKSIVEILTKSYASTYSKNIGNIITVRAGNIFGGGDFGQDRLITDFYEALTYQKKLILRNKNAIRPWQHIHWVIYCYLKIIKFYYNKKNEFDTFNIGPTKKDHITVEEFIKLFTKFNKQKKLNIEFKSNFINESKYLYLNSNKFKNKFNLKNKLKLEDSIKMTNDWYEKYFQEETNIFKYSMSQLEASFSKIEKKNSTNK